MKTTSFKMTELGPIPSDWEVKRLGEVFSLLRNNTYARESLTEEGGSVFNIHYGDVLIKFGAIVDFDRDSIPYLKPSVPSNKDTLQDGDLIFADTAEDETVGKACEVANLKGRKAVSGLHTILCRPSENLFASGYLGYYINSAAYHNQLLPLITGTKVSSISRGGLESTLIVLPPVPEQRRIASALSDVDELIGELGKLVEKKRAIKTGAMQRLLTGQTRLPGFGGKWEEKRLGDWGMLIRETENHTEFPDKLFVEYSMPAFDAGKTPQIVIGKSMLSSRTKIHGEVLLFNKLNVRQRRIWHVELCADNAICSSEFLPYYSDTIDLRLLAYALDTEQSTKHFIDVSKGTSNSQKRISPQDFEDYRVILPPPLPEQRAIAAVLSDMDAEITALEAEQAKYTRIKSGMMQELLTGKVRLGT